MVRSFIFSVLAVTCFFSISGEAADEMPLRQWLKSHRDWRLLQQLEKITDLRQKRETVTIRGLSESAATPIYRIRFRKASGHDVFTADITRDLQGIEAYRNVEVPSSQFSKLAAKLIVSSFWRADSPQGGRAEREAALSILLGQYSVTDVRLVENTDVGRYPRLEISFLTEATFRAVPQRLGYTLSFEHYSALSFGQKNLLSHPMSEIALLADDRNIFGPPNVQRSEWIRIDFEKTNLVLDLNIAGREPHLISALRFAQQLYPQSHRVKIRGSGSSISLDACLQSLVANAGAPLLRAS
jgi:hypothetical protein